MKKLLPTLLLSIVLCACATAPQVPTALMPVAVACPIPSVPLRPLPAPEIADNNTPDDVRASLIAVYVEQLSSYADALIAILNGYKK